MEHKTWLWRRKSSEKTTVISEKSDLSLDGHRQEKEKALELGKHLEDLNEQLSSARAEANAKDDILTKQAKVAEEAIAGWEKAEMEAASFKQELDDAFLQKVAAEERMMNTDTALKECMQQLRIIKDQRQNIIDNAAMELSREKEKARALEERLSDARKKLAKSDLENSNLNKLLDAKEKLIENLSEYKSQLESDFEAIVARLDSSEKTNASLKYEVCMLQKELEIRNEEREFNLKSAEAAHRQHLESIKKITKLETECQRLRVMVRKRLPGPAALSKMRNEVEMLGNNSDELRRKKPNFAKEGFIGRELVVANGDDASSKRIGSLMERLHAVEEENKILKEALTRKNSEVRSSRVMFARTASKLSRAETQLEELSKGQTGLEMAKSSPVSYNFPCASISEKGGSEDNISTAESWASALISELEHFKSEKPTTPSCKTGGVSDISLMDDFIEMERLAIVCVEKPIGSSDISSGENNLSVVFKETDSRADLSEATGKELVPIDDLSEPSGKDVEIQSSYRTLEKYPIWIQDILRVILHKHHKTKRSLDDILDDVRAALNKRDLSVEKKLSNSFNGSNHKSQETWHTSADIYDETFGMGLQLSESSKRVLQSSLEKSVYRLIDLTEGIIRRSITNKSSQHLISENDGSSVPNHKASSLSGYLAHVFLLKSSELNSVLEHFITICNDLLCGKADLENFLHELISTLDWIINHCFSFQDVSNMKEMIKKHFDGDQSQSDNEFEAGINNKGPEIDKTDAPEEPGFKSQRSFPLLTSSNGLDILMQMEEIESRLTDENRRLRYEIINMESRKKDLEARLGSASAKNASLINQLCESEENISNLKAELAKLNKSKGMIEDQIENQKLINEDLGTQLTVAQVELNEARQKFSSLEVELENKSNCCEELEETCLELQLQLESMGAGENPKYNQGPEEKQLRMDWEISAASEKLAECQETILNLGKQLKALASPMDAALFDKVISSPTTARTIRRPLLLDQMRAVDDAKFEELKSPKTKEIIGTELQKPPTAASDNPNAGLLYGRKILPNNGTATTVASIIQQSPVNSPRKLPGSEDPNEHNGENNVGALAIVPKKQKGGVSLLRRLLSRKKRESSKKVTLLKVA